jgi:hypothetical protein
MSIIEVVEADVGATAVGVAGEDMVSKVRMVVVTEDEGVVGEGMRARMAAEVDMVDEVEAAAVGKEGLGVDDPTGVSLLPRLHSIR